MAEYKGIKGFKVQTVSTDPAANQYAGGTWSSGGSLNTSRYGNAGAGTLTSGLSIDGFNPSVNALVEEYNGTSWSEIAENNTARAFGVGAGANAEAALFFSGNVPPSLSAANESYNGTAWTEIADLATARRNACGAGTQTAAICIGGANNNPPDTNRLDVVEVWNGTSWTEVAEVNTAGGDAASAGTSTDSIKAGTSNGPGLTVELWNGTSWTETTELNTGRYYLRGSGPSGLTDTLVFGGQNPPGAQAVTEKWDGSTWTELSDMASARGAMASTNTTSSEAWAAGGTSDGGSTYVTTTEEWSAPALFSKSNLGQVFYNSTSNVFKVTQQSVPIGSWSSGGNMNTGRASMMVNSVSGGLSGQTDAIGVSGASPPGTNLTNVELYNGSSWTETTDVNTGRRLGGGAGGQPAAVIAGGYVAANTGATEIWNGSTWTETTDLNTARRQFTGSFGTTDSSSDLLVCGSFPATGATEIWNGSAWTEVNDLNTGRWDGASMGTSTLAGLVAGGQSSPAPIPGQTAFAESWNGTSWTEVAEFNTNRMNFAGAGAQTDGIIFGGFLDPGTSATTEYWNGTSWTELNDLATAVTHNSGGGSTGAGISFGGVDGFNGTEEWTAGSVNNTITVS
jgi:hypothetical protein